jgi:hypothetical protein
MVPATTPAAISTIDSPGPDLFDVAQPIGQP